VTPRVLLCQQRKANSRGGLTLAGMAEWWSIEVFDSELQAALSWKESYRTQLVESAITSGAIEWSWIEHRHGVVFEVCFADDARWEGFRSLPGVQAALDAVPDPVNGVLVYRGRGGGAGARTPRKPRPSAGAGALELPEPAALRTVDLSVAELSPEAANL
jgi:hypothetical protein